MSVHKMRIQTNSQSTCNTNTHTMYSAAPSQTLHYFWNERSVKVQQNTLYVFMCMCVCLSAGWSETLFAAELRYFSLLQNLETSSKAHPIKLTIHLHLRLRSRMSAALPLLLLHVCVCVRACARACAWCGAQWQLYRPSTCELSTTYVHIC